MEYLKRLLSSECPKSDWLERVRFMEKLPVKVIEYYVIDPRPESYYEGLDLDDISVWEKTSKSRLASSSYGLSSVAIDLENVYDKILPTGVEVHDASALPKPVARWNMIHNELLVRLNTKRGDIELYYSSRDNFYPMDVCRQLNKIAREIY